MKVQTLQKILLFFVDLVKLCAYYVIIFLHLFVDKAHTCKIPLWS